MCALRKHFIILVVPKSFGNVTDVFCWGGGLNQAPQQVNVKIPSVLGVVSMQLLVHVIEL